MANSKYIEELIERDKPMPMGRYYWSTEEFKNDPPLDECGVCGHIIHPEYDNFCSRCGQRIMKDVYKL